MDQLLSGSEIKELTELNAPIEEIGAFDDSGRDQQKKQLETDWSHTQATPGPAPDPPEFSR